MNIQKLIDANESVKGTNEYGKYKMEKTYKRNGKWVFLGWSIPFNANYENYTIKKVKGNIYLHDDENRYKLTEEVIKILEIEK